MTDEFVFGGKIINSFIEIYVNTLEMIVFYRRVYYCTLVNKWTFYNRILNVECFFKNNFKNITKLKNLNSEFEVFTSAFLNRGILPDVEIDSYFIYSAHINCTVNFPD